MKKDHPHDKFFKQAFSYRQVALDYFKNFVSPKLIKQFDLRTLQKTSDSYIDDEMAEYFSDMVFSISWKKDLKKKNIPKVYLLMEHKSYLPKFIHVQLLKYMVEVWTGDIKNKNPLTLIIPIVIYHGKRKWHYRPFYDFFKLPSDDFYQFIPKFEYVLTDLNIINDEKLLLLKAGFLVNLMIALKHSGDENYLKRNAVNIFVGLSDYIDDEEGLNFARMLSVYIKKTTELDRTEIGAIFKDLPKPLKDITMSTYDNIMQAGVEKGVEIGLGQGLEKIKKFIAILMKKFPEMSDKELHETFNIDLKLIKEIRDELKK